jgi:acylphosphatase
VNDDVGPGDQPPKDDAGGSAEGLGWPAADVAESAAGVPGPAAGVAGPAAGVAEPASARLTAWVEGRVHGVGFRWWVRAQALELGLVGAAENLADGRVKIIAEGRADHCRELLSRLEGPGTPGRVARVTQRWDHPWGGLTGFVER